MFIINLTYKKNLSLVDKHLKEHISYLNKNYHKNNFICSGRKSPRTEGIILCNAKSLGEVNAIIKEDIFFKLNIADFEITEFEPSMASDNFKSILESK